MAINVTLYKKLPYDPTTDFIPLAGLARVPFVLIVNPSLPVHSLLELIKCAEGAARTAVVRVGRARRSPSSLRRSLDE
jgi:tripartite-type tricarboxylate transporter receptor subunit TctC